MSTRREVILSWLREKRQTWRLCYLLGEAGSGKTWLAQQLQKDKHRRVITLSLVVSWQGKAAWIVTDDNAAEQGCRDSAWTRDEMAGQLLHALHRTDSRCPLITPGEGETYGLRDAQMAAQQFPKQRHSVRVLW